MTVDLTGAREMLRRFATDYGHLRLYRSICLGAADDPDGEVASLLGSARPGQARPVLLLAALHRLVLDQPDLPAARWYPSVTGEPVPEGDPWPDVRAAALAHADALRATIATRSTQTNEVNRSAYLLPALARACADVPDAPVALLEAGASAGLLLGLDRFRVEIVDRTDRTRPDPDDGSTTVVLGDPTSPVHCRTELRGGDADDLIPPRISARVGLDPAPVALTDDDGLRWLEACLWPEVPGRVERFRAAVDLLRTDPPDVVAGDAVDDLTATAHALRAVATADEAVTGRSDPTGAPRPGPGADGPERERDAEGGTAPVHLVVASSWALTYVEAARRSGIADALAGLALDGRPVSWLTAEPPGCMPGVDAPDVEPGGETVLAVRRWRDGEEVEPAVLGTAHPHGAWLRLAPR